MDIFSQDPNDVRLRPEEVRLREVQAMPLLDGNRVKVLVELTPFIKRPNLEITITTASGKEVAHASILETMLRKVEVILHMRGTEPGSEYTLESTVYYQSLPEPSDNPMDLTLPDPMIVDRQKVIFLLPPSET
ncbi:MAG: hypothetical protein A2030_04310 [Chloroflexi bacterium RBG_19FT_COMBO_50_10]|nr:MAG: hypothetical protein A2030_04310 [Chloroflexi bacterium RBG_19FT_COMBO_50_10]